MTSSPAPRPLVLVVLCTLLTVSGLATAGCASDGAAPAEQAVGTAPSETAPSPTPAADAGEGPAEVAEPLPATPPGPDGAAGPTTCFYGPVTQTPAGGEPLVNADRLIRRTLEPEASRIVEETVRIDRAPNRRPRPYRVIYTVDGDEFDLAEEDGEYSGSGTLEGEPWRWTAWDFRYTLQSGIRLSGRYEFRPGAGEAAGGAGDRLMLVGDLTAYGPDGSEALHLHEELAQISAEECAERLTPGSP